MRIYLIIAAIIALVLYMRSRVNRPGSRLEDGREEGVLDMAQDPVCGDYVEAAQATVRRHGGETRYYCSEACARKDTPRGADWI